MRWAVVLAIALLAGGLLGYGWRLFARYAAERDWIYHATYNPRPPGMTSLGLFEEIYQPSIRYVVDEIASEKARGSQGESGEGD